MRKMLSIVLLALIVLAAGCTEKATTNVQLSGNGELKVAAGEDTFAVEFYKEIAKGEGNVLFSPYSIHTALAMTYEGVRGRTAGEMRSILHLPEDRSERLSGFRKLITDLNPQNGPYSLETANALWIQKDHPLKKSYVSIIKKYYLGTAEELDFSGDPEKAADTINRWTEEHTHGKIKDLVSPDSVRNSRFVLTNAVYMSGRWVHPFEPELTANETFHTPSGDITVEMMHTAGVFNYTEVGGVQVLELPYRGGRVSMVVFLPRGVDGYRKLDGNMSVDYILDALGSMKPENVSVSIPKFEMSTEYKLKETLRRMGMVDAFTEGADFSGMSDERLFISDVIHKAYIKVAENGTEAAAATAVIGYASAPVITREPKFIEFRADHPFAFIIVDKETKEILFMGRLVNPGE
ncbi:hypothetical protein A3L09_09130 [Thermococcus profundus]|uniref:Serpin domain-containing protein n=1 Tax=Thermococcus profundus TaxID=49899 RepID=A0A2Z2MD10_THEPR|nr:serpin family protein [Thermococcus profundus]ASJ03409.1 hypothetical protein A3L09_09130 [Thermococcus profundus]